MLYEVSNGNYVIVSVDPRIKDVKNNKSLQKGGHLVLITGFNRQNRTILFHNSDGILDYSQINYEITFNEFLRFFAGRGIIIY